MLNLCTLMSDNAFHTGRYRDDDECFDNFSGGCGSSRSEQYNPIPLHLVVPRDPIHHTYELSCTCSGCLKYKQLIKEHRS